MLINHVWFEGLVTKVHRESQITVAFPGADGADSSEIVVFADSSGDVWAREAFNKKSAKRAGLRRGWAFSGTLSGKWLVRGQACASAVTSDCRNGEASTFLRGEAPAPRARARPRRRPRRRRDVRPRGIVTLRVLRWRWRRNGPRV